MSDYYHKKVVRMKLDNIERFGVEDKWDLEDKFKDLFDTSKRPHFEIALTESDFLDLVLFCDPHSDCTEFGTARRLTKAEIDEYLPRFQEIVPDVVANELHYVDFCWYNCTEAPDYFEINAFSEEDKVLFDILSDLDWHDAKEELPTKEGEYFAIVKTKDNEHSLKMLYFKYQETSDGESSEHSWLKRDNFGIPYAWPINEEVLLWLER